jgi:phosphoglycerol transferase MdoB-like AlkP superfamily enzyme
MLSASSQKRSKKPTNYYGVAFGVARYEKTSAFACTLKTIWNVGQKSDMNSLKVTSYFNKSWIDCRTQITHIDYELGRLFGELKNQGLWENTVILFTSDHGDMLGDQRLFHKTFLAEDTPDVCG